MDLINGLFKKLNRKPTVQEIQDEIFDRMSTNQKLKLAGQLSKLGIKLSRLDDGNYRSNSTVNSNSPHSR